MSKVFLAARIILGLILFVFGLNFYFEFIPVTPPPMPEAAITFMTGLMAAPYMMHLIKASEIICGALLLLNLYVPLSLIIIAPVMVNILLFHTVLAPSGIAITLAMTLCYLILIYAYWDAYENLLEAKSDTDI